MCLITVKPYGVDLPKDEHLKNGESANSDGIGVALKKKDETLVTIKKDFKNIYGFLEWMHANVVKEDICVIHFRNATSGLKDEGNRHPFPVTHNYELLRRDNVQCKQIVAHNGVMHEYSYHKKYSDTQKFIIDILADSYIKENLKNRTIRKLIGSYIGRDRLCILDGEDVYLFGKFEREGGVLYSTYSYKWKPMNNNGWNWRGNNFKENGNWKKPYQKQIGFKNYEEDDSHNTLCDGCLEVKFVRKVILSSGKVLWLCKKCRKRSNKNQLNIPEKPSYEKDNLVKCSSCDIWLPKEELTVYGGKMLCEWCVGELTNNTIDY